MFGMGMGELLLILVIALLIFGPDKLPQVARNVGKFMSNLKRTTDDIRFSIEREINMSELKDTLDIPAEVKRQMNDIVLPPDEVERRRQRVLRGEPAIPLEADPYAELTETVEKSPVDETPETKQEETSAEDPVPQEASSSKTGDPQDA